MSPSALRRVGLFAGIAAALMIAASIVAPVAFENTYQRAFDPFRRPVSLRIMSGFQGTALHVLARELAEQIEIDHPGRFRIEVLTSDGSGQTIPALVNGSVDVGFVTSIATQTLKELRGLASIATQHLHLIVPVDSPIRRVGDFDARTRVSLGPPGGAPDIIGRQLFQYYKVSPTIVPAEGQGLARNLIEDLDAGRLDAAMRFTLLHSANVEAPLASGRYRLVPFEDLVALTRYLPGTEAGVIPAGTYDPGRKLPENVRGDVATLTTPQILASRSGLGALTVQRLLETIYNPAFARRAHLSTLSEATGQAFAVVPMHPAARTFYTRNEPVSGLTLQMVSLVMSAIGLLWGAFGVSKLFDRKPAARRSVATDTVKALNALSHRADSALDAATLDAIQQEATLLHRRAMEAAASSSLSAGDLDVIRHAYEECAAAAARRRPSVRGSVFTN